MNKDDNIHKKQNRKIRNLKIMDEHTDKVSYRADDQ